ncbi:MAG: hypothetical protein IK077_02780 [Thermoguttaceae bacterium]|nr:hypothetical protein [Thermoguttaceae bacterium]
MAFEDTDKKDWLDEDFDSAPETLDRTIQRVDADSTLAHYETVRRDLWATAAFAALAYLAIVAMGFVGLRGHWSVFPLFFKAGVLILGLAATYVVAYLGSRFGNPPLSKLFSIFGTLFFGTSLALLSREAPNTIDVEGLERLGDAFAAIAPFWAVGAFALAAAFQARTLHYCAAVLILFWLAVDHTGLDAVFALIFCAIGEYWAWKHRRASVASVYFILTLWLAITETFVWTRSETWVLVAAAFSALFYWFGANFNNAPVRGFAMFIAACSLGAASFPTYWAYAIPEELQAQFGSFASTRLPAILASALFIAFCVNVTLGGVQRSTARFIFGVAITAIWTACQAIYASQEFGAFGAVVILGIVGAIFGAMVALERSCRAKLGWEPGKPFAPEHIRQKDDRTIPKDDPEFDDPIESEARRLQDAGPVLALQIFYERAFDSVARAARQPLIGFAVALQFVLLLLNTIMQWR